MAEKKENKTNKKPRTQVKDLPKNEKELTVEERKKVKGGGWLMTPSGNAMPSGS